ncbi:hypothetical protein EDC44_1514 [Cricetibacter osteomyelitidis]|uniref:Uncharacterized protein n=1 Tax=Cricetibacter osteomyelitidis TaxID=1521931 RepID=A0A4R2SVU1_9PAST|nr:hypothetical protein EDC44_1514 [Cricetibacter osteomyelitidis]
MFLKKYWKSSIIYLISIVIIILFSIFDSYMDNYVLSIGDIIMKDFFWMKTINYILIYSFAFIILIFFFKNK